TIGSHGSSASASRRARALTRDPDAAAGDGLAASDPRIGQERAADLDPVARLEHVVLVDRDAVDPEQNAAVRRLRAVLEQPRATRGLARGQARLVLEPDDSLLGRGRINDLDARPRRIVGDRPPAHRFSPAPYSACARALNALTGARPPVNRCAPSPYSACARAMNALICDRTSS